jgi:hypothetical protein
MTKPCPNKLQNTVKLIPPDGGINGIGGGGIPDGGAGGNGTEDDELVAGCGGIIPIGGGGMPLGGGGPLIGPPGNTTVQIRIKYAILN